MKTSTVRFPKSNYVAVLALCCSCTYDGPSEIDLRTSSDVPVALPDASILDAPQDASIRSFSLDAGDVIVQTCVIRSIQLLDGEVILDLDCFCDCTVES
jgi:hypothetical protein